MAFNPTVFVQQCSLLPFLFLGEGFWEEKHVPKPFILCDFILPRKVELVAWEGNSEQVHYNASSVSCLTLITTWQLFPKIPSLLHYVLLLCYVFFGLILLFLIIVESNDWSKYNQVHMWILTEKQQNSLQIQLFLHMKQEKKVPQVFGESFSWQKATQLGCDPRLLISFGLLTKTLPKVICQNSIQFIMPVFAVAEIRTGPVSMFSARLWR